MTADEEEWKRTRRAHQIALDDREAKLTEREDKLLDRVTMQAIALVLLKALRKNGKIKPADLNEIRFARNNWDNDDYNPHLQLQRILAETFMDKEEKRPTPQKN